MAKSPGYVNSGDRVESCTRCPFRVSYFLDNIPGRKARLERNRVVAQARAALASHYISRHLPIGLDDLSPSRTDIGALCYSCTLCSFQTFPIPQNLFYNSSTLASKKKSAMNDLYKHYTTLHDQEQVELVLNQTTNNHPPEVAIPAATASSNSSLVSSKAFQLLEGRDFFNCPFPGCHVYSPCSGTECPSSYFRLLPPTRRGREEAALECLGRHYLKVHDFPLLGNLNGDEGFDKGTVGSNPCVTIIVGQCWWKCPRCEFYFIIKASPTKKLTAEDKAKIGGHYGSHLYQNGKQLKPDLSVLLENGTSMILAEQEEPQQEQNYYHQDNQGEHFLSSCVQSEVIVMSEQPEAIPDESSDFWEPQIELKLFKEEMTESDEAEDPPSPRDPLA
jgi:hypothetical protein